MNDFERRSFVAKELRYYAVLRDGAALMLRVEPTSPRAQGLNLSVHMAYPFAHAHLSHGSHGPGACELLVGGKCYNMIWFAEAEQLFARYGDADAAQQPEFFWSTLEAKFVETVELLKPIRRCPTCDGVGHIPEAQ